MDSAPVPLSVQCRNAKHFLRNAAMAKKSQLFNDELRHLHQYETLVSATIPDHPHFEEMKTEKQIVELQIPLANVRKRIQELESDTSRSHVLGNFKSSSSSSKSEKSTPRSKSSTKSPRLTESSMPSAHIAYSAKPSKKTSRALPIPTTLKRPEPLQQQQKLQSWGVWTANPQDSPVSPPSKKHSSSTHKSRKIGGDLKSPTSSSARDAPFLLPPRSRSPDQRAEAIVGGCALLASHLQSFDDTRENLEPKREEHSVDFIDGDKLSGSWLSNYHKGRDKVDEPDVPNIENDVKSSEKGRIGGRRFRFASDYFEKRLQGTLSRMQRYCSNTDEDPCGNSPSKSRISPGKSHETALKDQESSEENPSNFGKLHTTFGSLRQCLDTNADSSFKGERQPTIDAGGDNSLGKHHLTNVSDDDWARKIVPVVEHKLTHEMLRACASPGHSPSNYSRKKHKRKDILSVMDHAIRQAVDSDSEFDASDSKDVKDSSKSPRVLQQRQEGEDKHTVKSVEEEYQHHPPAFQGLQVEALEKKITSLQSLVGDLKRSVEGFTSRVEEDVGAWQCRVQGVEAEMMNWRDQADSELMNMRGDIQAEVQKKLEELTKGLNKVERTLTETESRKETTKQRLEARLEECTAQLDSVKEQVDSIVSDLKLSLSRDMKERVQDMTKGLKGDLNLLEVGISKDLESVRKELDERFHDFCVESEKAMRLEKQQLEAWVEERVLKKLSPRIDIASGGKIDKALAEMKNELRTESERLRRAERQQIEVLIEERIQSRLTQPMEIVSGGKEKVMAEMKEELQLLWAEVDLLIEGREKIKDNMEQLNQVAEKAKEAIGKEHDLLKTENGSLKKQLQYFRKETMQLQMDSNDYKKETELEMTEFKENIRKLKQEGEDVKKSIDWLKKVQDNLIHDNESLRSLVEGVREESVVKIREAITMKRETEEYEMLRNAKDGNRDKALMEKVDKLSQLYLGGLEEIRLDLKNMKAACDNRIDELESQWGELKRQQENNAESEESLRGLVLDGLEMRLSHLENLLERKENLDHKLSKVQSIIDTIKKEREYAASALAQVTTASQKAEEFLTNTLDSFQSEMTDIQRQSIMIQEKIQSEKEAAAAALSEVLHMRDHLEKETEATISLLSDAKSRTMQFQEGLESGREALRSSITMAEEEREAAVLAAAGVAAAAEQADRALVEISEVRKKSISLSDHFTDALGDSHKKYNEILEDHIEECKKSILDEVSKAREHVELIEQERRKSLNDIEGWREKMRGEVDSAKILVEGIQEEKRKSVCIAEIEAAREKHDFEQHKQATNAMIEELGNAIREMVETLDSKLHTVSQQQFHAEQQDENFRKEIGELREKVEKAFMDLDRLAHESSQVAQELQSNRLQGEQDEHARSEMLQKDISALENIIRQTAAEQVTVLDKMERIEKTQNELVLSIEEIQSSTQELERSCVDWLQKYDVAARVLQDIEKRISSIENASLDEDNSDQRLENVSKCHQIAPQEKLRLIRLYRELSAFLQKMKSSVENTENLNTDGCFEDEWSKIFNDKMMALDTRMKHVETDAFPKLIELETKTEELSIGIQSALDGASNAENKCSALGAELVKVFRLLASSRKESPTKMMMGDGPDEDTEQHHLQHRSRCTRSHHAGSKSKSFSSHGACTFYKKAATKGSNDLVNCTKGDHDGEHIHLDKIDNTLVEGPKPGYYYDGSHFDNMSSNIDRGYIKENTPQGRPLIETQDISHGRAFHEGEDFILEKASKGNVSQNGKPHWKGDILEKIDGFDGFEHFLAKKNLSELKNFEGKLPLTQEKIEDGRLDCAKKSVTHTGSGKNCQSTNIRLETGKIQVNVSHRSAVMSGNRLTKRGDAISVRP